MRHHYFIIDMKRDQMEKNRIGYIQEGDQRVRMELWIIDLESGGIRKIAQYCLVLPRNITDRCVYSQLMLMGNREIGVDESRLQISQFDCPERVEY